jgi:cyclohexyl-isocyanide hydratase
MMKVGFLLFPRVTQLDLSGPYEVLARMPDTSVHLVGCENSVVHTEWGMKLLPTCTFADAPTFDVFCVPGGPGIDALLNDDVYLSYLSRLATDVTMVVSVCTGALVLGAAGLLRGYRATTHWLSLGLLSHLGAEPIRDRVVIDRNRASSAGVTAGIDLALALVKRFHGEEIMREIQLTLEYDPAPPINCGSPETASSTTLEMVRSTRDAIQERRLHLVLQAASRLNSICCGLHS